MMYDLIGNLGGLGPEKPEEEGQGSEETRDKMKLSICLAKAITCGGGCGRRCGRRDMAVKGGERESTTQTNKK